MRRKRAGQDVRLFLLIHIFTCIGGAAPCSQQRPHGRLPAAARVCLRQSPLFTAAAAQRILAAIIAFVAADAAAPVPAVAAAAIQTAAAAVIQTAIDAIAADLAAITVSLPAAGFLIAADLLLAAAFFAATDAIGTRTALLCGRRGVPAAVLPALRLPAAAPVFAEQDAIQ